MEKKCVPKNADFHCFVCDFKCLKKSNFETHCNTKKHIHRVNGNEMENVEIVKNAENICKCGKKYTTNSGLWKHSKNCNFKDNTTKNTIEKNEASDKDLIMILINENKELKTLMLEQQNMIMKVIENGRHNTTNNNTTTHTNSHNKAFNLNFFLNETCKDAMNIMDFVDSIKLQLSDLEGVGELGYVEGISKIILKNLKELDVTQRPVHCTDKKRETMYIKDEDKWEKDDERLKLHKVVRKVACKNQNLIPKFKEIHPDCGKYNSKFSDQYNKIIVESMGGSGDNDFEKEEKIIKNISKQVFIDKEETL
jgi:hypothetical protein